ncbi:hypothetical protein CR513_39917, partial [Mucuna pruriens]
MERTKIVGTLDGELEERLVCFLIENWDIFAWTPVDMPGIDPDFLCDRLSITQGTQPIAQRRRRLGKEKHRVAREETNKLLAVCFIKEVQYPTWLTNIVMVKRPSGKLWMCTYYMDMNKVCPKDLYTLPNIDRLVDGTSIYRLLITIKCLRNALSMHPQDEAKIAFIRDIRVFCYKVMSFGLKKTCATYKWLMDRIFKDIMGRDVEETSIEVEPKKCLFGVQAGKFLGFMLIERGIKANPKKCQVVIDMRSSRNIKEVQ